MVLGPPLASPEPRKSIYDQEIKPSEKKIIWYHLSEKLPDISPTDAPLDPRPPRATVKAKQTIVSGPKDQEGATQRIWMPAPEVATPKPLPLPNVIAVAPPKIVKQFVAPEDVMQRPKPATTLPEAPKVTAAVEAKPLALDASGPKPKPLVFTPPPTERMQRQAMLQLPEAPVTATVVEPNALPFEAAGARPQRKQYTQPGGARPRNDAPVALPNAPEIAAVTPNAAPGVKGIPRTFVAPPSRPAATGGAPSVASDAPEISTAATARGETSLAMVGLNPANMTEVPAPPGSRAAGFSAGPELRRTGSTGTAGGAALLGVPGLMVRGGESDPRSTLVAAAGLAPTSRENLAAAAHTAAKSPPPPAAPAAVPGATRVTEAPDPRLSGRVVYTVAIQMPNVTSFSGSWLVWFAEHEPVPGAPAMEIKPPVPLHKVDPKYVAAAAAERIEGKVRLYGVIRKDGRVDGIALIQHVDVRLDRTAAEALGQWVFEPALRNGRPVEVDAVFEIPFHLAPRAVK